MNGDLVAKYKQKLSEQLELQASMPSSQLYSREYQMFRKEILPPHATSFEKICNFCGKLLKTKVKPEKAAQMQDAISASHLQTTPSAVMAASFILPIAFLIIGVFFSLLVLDSMFFAFFSMLVGLAGIFLLQNVPFFLANQWRMKASNQMVLCVFYVVTYMRHTSNLENAIEFASEHLAPPLSLDLRKVIWDVESGKYENIKDSLEV